jgi:hypothetical protein
MVLAGVVTMDVAAVICVALVVLVLVLVRVDVVRGGLGCVRGRVVVVHGGVDMARGIRVLVRGHVSSVYPLGVPVGAVGERPGVP